jgi:hypothetical protein
MLVKCKEFALLIMHQRPTSTDPQLIRPKARNCIKEDLQRKIMGQDLGQDEARKRLFHVGVIIRCSFPLSQVDAVVQYNDALGHDFRPAEISGVI